MLPVTQKYYRLVYNTTWF